MSKLPSLSNDLGLLVSGVGDVFTLTSVDGLNVDFYGVYLPYMNDGNTVGKMGREESYHDRLLVQADENCPKFNAGDIIENPQIGRFIIQNSPRKNMGALWLELKRTSLVHGGKRGMYEV